MNEQRCFIMWRMTEQQANTVIDEVSEGRSIRSVCKERGFSRWGFYALLATNGVLADRLALAREIRDEGTEDEVLEIADEHCDDTVATSRQRNRLDARYKVLAARRPQRWGAKLDLSVTAKPDARAAEQRADARLLRYQPQHQLTQVIEGQAITLLRLADKQSASAMDQGPADVADDIFAAS